MNGAVASTAPERRGHAVNAASPSWLRTSPPPDRGLLRHNPERFLAELARPAGPAKRRLRRPVLAESAVAAGRRPSFRADSAPILPACRHRPSGRRRLVAGYLLGGIPFGSSSRADRRRIRAPSQRPDGRRQRVAPVGSAGRPFGLSTCQGSGRRAARRRIAATRWRSRGCAGAILGHSDRVHRFSRRARSGAGHRCALIWRRSSWRLFPSL